MFKIMTHTPTSRLGPVFTPGTSYKQTWSRFTGKCFMYTKYQSSTPSSFRELVTTGAGPVLNAGLYLYKLGRDPQGDVTYQISTFNAF